MMNAPTLKLKMKKSQAAIEFVIFVGVAVLVLMAYFWISNNYINMTYKQREIISGSDLVKELKNEINLAARVENNYNRHFKLPLSINGLDYSVSVNGREVAVTIGDDEYVGLLSVEIEDEKKFNSGETILITKSEDKVSLTKA